MPAASRSALEDGETARAGIEETKERRVAETIENDVRRVADERLGGPPGFKSSERRNEIRKPNAPPSEPRGLEPEARTIEELRKTKETAKLSAWKLRYGSQNKHKLDERETAWVKVANGVAVSGNSRTSKAKSVAMETEGRPAAHRIPRPVGSEGEAPAHDDARSFGTTKSEDDRTDASSIAARRISIMEHGPERRNGMKTIKSRDENNLNNEAPTTRSDQTEPPFANVGDEPVVKVDIMTDGVVRTFRSVRDAAEDAGMDACALRTHLDGDGYERWEFRWRYPKPNVDRRSGKVPCRSIDRTKVAEKLPPTGGDIAEVVVKSEEEKTTEVPGTAFSEELESLMKKYGTSNVEQYIRQKKDKKDNVVDLANESDSEPEPECTSLVEMLRSKIQAPGRPSSGVRSGPDGHNALRHRRAETPTMTAKRRRISSQNKPNNQRLPLVRTRNPLNARSVILDPPAFLRVDRSCAVWGGVSKRKPVVPNLRKDGENSRPGSGQAILDPPNRVDGSGASSGLGQKPVEPIFRDDGAVVNLVGL